MSKMSDRNSSQPPSDAGSEIHAPSGSASEQRVPRGDLSRFRPDPGAAASAGTSVDRDREADLDGVGEISARVRVDDQGAERPFMLGILVHSLTESGLSFDTAYDIARAIWQRVRDRDVVTKKELRQLAAELAAQASGGRLRASDRDPVDRLSVVGAHGRWPFNQARLQQSLLAAGLEPRRATEVVIEIEETLRRRGGASVTRDEIRALVAEILEDRFGRGFAARYRTWREFQNREERPVVLLLGGTSGVGKSTLAIEVARRLSIARVLSTDSVRDVMRVMLSEELVPTLHVSSFEAHARLTTGPREGIDPVVEGFLDQTRMVAVGVRAVIERALLEGTSTVIDGVSLVPGLFDLDEWSGRAYVFFLLAADQDRESLQAHLVARAHGKGARASERYVRHFSEIFRIQEDLLARAAAHGIPVVDVQDAEIAAQQVVAHVVDRLAERRAAERSVD